MSMYEHIMQNRTKLVLATIAAAACFVLATMSCGARAFADDGVSTQSDDGVVVYRLYNDVTSEHLFTTSSDEALTLANNYSQWNWKYEGVSWVAPSSGTPVHRLYNPGLGHHLYTADGGEISILCASWGWQDEGVAYYSGGNISIYRLYNPYLHGLHLITTSAVEYNVLPAHQWNQEGCVFYGLDGNGSAKAESEGFTCLSNGQYEKDHVHAWTYKTDTYWVPNVVTVVDSPAWDEVRTYEGEWHFDGSGYCCCWDYDPVSRTDVDCTFTFNTPSEWYAHQAATGHVGCHQNWTTTYRETIHHDAVTHTEDHGHSETVSYYACSTCGATQ